MARSFSQANRFGALVVQALSATPLRRSIPNLIPTQRGYAAACDVSVSVRGGTGSRSGMVGSIKEKGVARDGSEACSAWGPDPVTGYYRPINHTPEIDPVELRTMLLNHKLRSAY